MRPLGAGVAMRVIAPLRSRKLFDHGAGRRTGRKHAIRELDRQAVDAKFEAADIMSNCRKYPRDEARAAYKDFGAVLSSVK